MAIVDNFRLVLLLVLQEMKWTQTQLAQRLGVSTKTITRYVCSQSLPPVGRRHGIVYALRELPAPLLLRVAASLNVAADFAVELPRVTRDPELLRPALEAAVAEVAEKL